MPTNHAGKAVRQSVSEANVDQGTLETELAAGYRATAVPSHRVHKEFTFVDAELDRK